MARSDHSPRRFSLFSLLLGTAGVAVIVWLFCWKWDADEYVVLALWVASIFGGWLVDNYWRRYFGVVVGTLLGSILPPLGYWASFIVTTAVMRYVFGPIQQWMAFTLLVIAITSGLSSALAILVLRLMRRVAGARQWQAQAATMAGLLAVGLLLFVGGRLVFRRQQNPWLPVLTIADIDLKGRYAYPPFAISDDGRILVVGQTPPLGAKQATGWVRVWNVESGKEITPAGFETPLAQSLCLSPNGQLLAVVHNGISIYETATGRHVKSLSVPNPHLWAPQPCRFSPDGQSLVFCAADQKHKSVLIWATKDWTLRSERSLRHIAQPAVAEGRLVLLAGGPKEPLELLDLATLESIYPSRPLVSAAGPVLAPDGRTVGRGFQVVDLASGSIQDLAGPAHCFLGDGRFSVARRCDMEVFRSDGDWQWRVALPFARHWCRHDDSGQVVVFDVASGQEFCASPLYEREAFTGFQASDDGKTLVGSSFGGKFRVWRLPKR